MELARRILGPLGRGVEIGASALNPFPGVRAWNVDYPGGDVFQRAQLELTGRVARVHAWATAERLPFRGEALDFLLSSHVLEHMPDAIRALGEWDRVLRIGGVAFLIVPHRERTFDRVRPRTDLRHHLADYALGTTAATDPLVPTSHYHVWVTADLLALIELLVRERFLAWEVEEVEEVDSKAGNGFTIVARKRARAPALPPAPPAPVAFHQLTPRFPFQVIGRTLETIVPGESLPERPDVARGLYRAVPVHAGFPPRAGEAFDVEVGEAVPAPVLRSAEMRGTKLVLAGEHLFPTTWLEARYPDGQVHLVLPEWEDGALSVELEGLVLPEEAFPVAAVNPPPGGGRGPALDVHP